MADFPIVGIGSSAGGLEALEKLFDAMPPDAGVGVRRGRASRPDAAKAT